MTLARAITIVTLFLTLSVPAASQSSAKNQEGPRTKIEAFQAKTGSVLIKGYTPVGSIPGRYGGSVKVTAMELRDGSGPTKVLGIAIDIKEGGRLETERRSFIDFEEIESLVKRSRFRFQERARHYQAAGVRSDLSD